MTEDAVSVHIGAGSQYIPKLYSGMIDGSLSSSYMELGGWDTVLLF